MKTILITGASRGLGEALALAYAAPGVRLFLSGRDPDQLAATVASCRTRGAEAEGQIVDVTDAQAMSEWVLAADAVAPLDLVIANAGISGGTGGHAGDRGEPARDIFAVNLDGVVNTVLPILPAMRRRGHGQIALMSSLAGFRGLASAPAYCASKAAVRIWGEGLRGWLAHQGIGVTVLCPGFVATQMTARNPFPMPFLWTADKAAGRMRRAIDANRARAAFPWPLAIAVWILAAVPPAITDRWLRRLPGKS